MRIMLIFVSLAFTACGGVPFTTAAGDDVGMIDDAGMVDAVSAADAATLDGPTAEASTSEATSERFDGGSTAFDASSDAPDAPTCTAIPFQARSGCPSAAACMTCSDPLIYAPAAFWLGCTQAETPVACQCAETYNCDCLVAALTPSCNGAVVCDANAAAPALLARCIEE